VAGRLTGTGAGVASAWYGSEGSSPRGGAGAERTDPLHPPPPYTLKKCAPYFSIGRSTPSR
jgi:hypothetical protein